MTDSITPPPQEAASCNGQHPSHESKKSRKAGPNAVPVVGKRDEFIMDTNNSSIVSKRSVEKLYFAGQPEYFRYFVRKFKRRSPLINRGYWLRMKAIEKSVARFLADDDSKIKLVINLGCGYDPLAFQFLGMRPEACERCVFIDVDYPQLIQKKIEMIKDSPALLDLLPGFTVASPPESVLGSSSKYRALGCNLNDVVSLDRALRQIFDLGSETVSTMLVAEVSIAYMERKHADAVLRWAAGIRDARFCLLEQHLPDGPDHPFAATMLKHFEKLKTPLHTIGSIEQMLDRFVTTGWQRDRLMIKSLWQLWSDNSFMSPDERRSLDKIEPFDEWEEFALFGSHYFLLDARTPRAFLPRGFDSSGHRRFDSKHNATYVSLTFDGSSLCKRRFAASIGPALDRFTDEVAPSISLAGGLGAQERVRTVDTFAIDQYARDLPDLPEAVMCHTLTRIDPFGSEVLLVGGRTSPERASEACYVTTGKTWRQVESLPVGRYRHCAISVRLSTERGSSRGVLVYGGKSSTGKLLNDWWLFDTKNGWQEINLVTDESKLARTLTPRFGATMAATSTILPSGVVMGGMADDGVVLNDMWAWKLTRNHGRLQIECGESDMSRLPERGRFGAQIVRSMSTTVLIGGIMGGGMLGRDTEIMDVWTCRPYNMEHATRPLLVGHTALDLGDGLTGIFGGGATCFSFGTCWSTSCVIADKDWLAQVKKAEEICRNVKLIRWTADTLHPTNERRDVPIRAKLNGTNGHTMSEPVPVPTSTLQTFQEILLQSEPVIIKNLDLGDCTSKWTPDYLEAQVGPDREMVVHEASGPDMDFQSKNFSYRKMAFSEFIDAASKGEPCYLRSLSSSKPADVPTNLATDFPTLAADFVLPPQLEVVQRNQHSSPLRISGQVNMWLHYDVLANIYCQIRGSKTLRLYNPSDVTHLGIPAGGSSSSLNVWDPETEAKLRSRGVQTHEMHVAEGDVLFIPPLWLHAARPDADKGCSVAVNVFFRDERMQEAYALGKDVYGNRDVAAYEQGRELVQRVVKKFDGLPEQVREFYLGRLAEEMRGGI